MIRFSFLLGICALATGLTSCGLTEFRDVVVTTSPQGADVYLNDRYAGKSPTAQKVPNRKQLDIYIDKDGYYPIEKTIIPEASFWGWLLWDRVEDKSLSLPEDTFEFRLEKMPDGVKKKPRPRRTQPAPEHSIPRLF